jgi:glucuronoarabinoxylan endo-1,4-beta-xylanase
MEVVMKHKISTVMILILSILLTACNTQKTDLTTDNLSVNQMEDGNVQTTNDEADTAAANTATTDTATADTASVTGEAVSQLDSSYAPYSFDISEQYQKIDGFGAAYTWYSDWLMQCDDQEGAFDALFSDAKLTVLRFKNEYEYNRDDYAGNANTMVKYYQEAKKRAEEYGEEPIVLMSCWSPPAKLKTNNDISGKATLKKDEKGNYCYDEYAAWWAESIEYYESQGIQVDYVSIQNEADFAAEYDGCRFEPQETQEYASYAKAYLAVYYALQERFGESAPKMLGPETMSLLYPTVNYYMKDIIETEPDSIYGLAHHLYIGGQSDSNNNSVDPNSFIINMMDLNSHSNGYKKWQTEFYIGHALETALLINHSMTYEQANAYLYWSGTWTDESGTFENGYLMGIKLGRGNWITDTGWRLCGDYYAIRHFSEFIRPGYLRVKATTKDKMVSTSAYRNEDASKVVLVLINTSDVEKKYQIIGSDYTIQSSSIYQSIFGDESQSDENCFIELGSLGVNNELTLPAKSVTSIDITGSYAE